MNQKRLEQAATRFLKERGFEWNGDRMSAATRPFKRSTYSPAVTPNYRKPGRIHRVRRK